RHRRHFRISGVDRPIGLAWRDTGGQGGTDADQGGAGRPKHRAGRFARRGWRGSARDRRAGFGGSDRFRSSDSDRRAARPSEERAEKGEDRDDPAESGCRAPAHEPARPSAPARAAHTPPPALAPAALAARPISMAPARAANAETGKYVVQVAARRSEADAQGSLRALQHKYQGVLGSYQVMVQRADL